MPPSEDLTRQASTASERAVHGVSRNVVVGKNSVVWKALAPLLSDASPAFVAIGHAELARFGWQAGDRVWVLSYSRIGRENLALLDAIDAAGVREIVYLSSSSTIVQGVTTCYEYPRVKLEAEGHLMVLAKGRILTVGLMHAQASELPAGLNMATRYDELARFMAAPVWDAPQAPSRQTLFRAVRRPFGSGVESALFQLYGRSMRLCGRHPCLLRGFDVLLRALDMRWYGYTYLSNQLWTIKIS